MIQDLEKRFQFIGVECRSDEANVFSILVKIAYNFLLSGNYDETILYTIYIHASSHSYTIALFCAASH
jgi:hypothetical protein